MPRHPPCALHSLPNTNTQQKQQRHTLQKQTPTPPHPTTRNPLPSQQQEKETPAGMHSAGDARVHYPEIKQPVNQTENTTPQRTPSPRRARSLRTPTVCPNSTPPPAHPDSTRHPHPCKAGARANRSTTRQATGRAALRRRLHYPNTTMTPPDTRRQSAPTNGMGVCSLERR
jgi:hypothetical protein